ncbi:MAG: hypothetical protein J7L88_05725, partial [Thermoplasmata archaeon]|nr:hypothetical protein [Thermoplasmata archaeon]
IGLLIFTGYALVILLPTPISGDRNGDKVGDLVEDVEMTYVVKVVEGEVKYFPTGYEGHISPPKVILLLGFPLLVLPSTLYVLVYSYPFTLVKRRRLNISYDLPLSVGAMAISLEMTPSLSEAVKLSTEVVGGEMSEKLKRCLWRAETGAAESLEEEMRNLAEEMGQIAPEFKSALLQIVTASLEKGEEGVRRAADAAIKASQEGLRGNLKRYVSGLKTPALILFSLGVILPLMLAAVLPLTGYGKDDLPKTVAFFNVAIPLATVLYGTSILSRRPPLSRPVNVSPNIRMVKYAAVASLGFLAILIVQTEMRLASPTALVAESVVLTSILFSLLGALLYIPGRRLAEEAIKIEENLPDALYYLGSRVSEGDSLLNALQKTSTHLRSSAVSRIFEGVISRLKRTKVSLYEAFFGPEGVLLGHPSSLTTTALLITIRASERNPEATGRLLLRYANFLKEMRKVREEMLEEISSTVGMMEATAAFFAPVILGVTVSMYGAFSRSIGGIGAAGFETAGVGTLAYYNPISEAAFLAIAGAYMIFLVVFLSLFSGVLKSREEGPLKFRGLMVNPAVAGAIFILSFYLSSTLF